jgi:hypothetical protein
LIGSFCPGFTYCDDRERDSDGNIIFICPFIRYIFVGFHIVVSGNVFFMFDYDIKEKEHQNTRQSDSYSGATPPRTNQIASCFDALSVTYTLVKIKFKLSKFTLIG